MSTETMTRNGQKEQAQATEAEFELDIEGLREALGINALEEENKALRELLSELLTYTNYVDLSLQELLGEPTVTETLQYNVARGGRVQVQRQRPPAPANLTRTKLEMLRGENG